MKAGDQEQLERPAWQDRDLSDRPQEVWKTVPCLAELGVPMGWLQASSHGRVKVISRIVSRGAGRGRLRLPERILKQRVDRGGYLMVQIRAGGRRASLLVNRAVCAAFHGPDLRSAKGSAGLHARHLDGNRLNSAPGNLAWGSAAENAADKGRHGTVLRGEQNPRARLAAGQVAAIERLVHRGLPQTSVARIYRVSLAAVNNIVRGRNWASVPRPIDPDDRRREIAEARSEIKVSRLEIEALGEALGALRSTRTAADRQTSPATISAERF